jgi:membrane protease YdiL (CAAX protease family)
MNTSLSKAKALSIAFEGTAVLVIIYLLGNFYLMPYISNSLPFPTSSMLFSAVSPAVAIIYLLSRVKQFPHLGFAVRYFYVIIIGILISAASATAYIKYFPSAGGLVSTILVLPGPFYINLFLFLIWNPVTEEIVFRGYILELIRTRWNTIFAIVLSTALFVFPHVFFNGLRSPLYFSREFLGYLLLPMLPKVVFSVVVSIVYLRTGIMGAVLAHVVMNFYSLCLYAL